VCGHLFFTLPLLASSQIVSSSQRLFASSQSFVSSSQVSTGDIFVLKLIDFDT